MATRESTVRPLTSSPGSPRRLRSPRLCVFLCVAAALLGTTASHAQSRLGIGQVATPAQIAAWNIDVSPDGRNLPAGQGSVAKGREVYVAQCASCHGALGEGGLGDKLAGGQGTLASAAPVKTVGSFWPYATTLFDYIRRAMPFYAPQSLSNEEVYSVSAYVLFLNGLVADNTVLDASTLLAVKMPNRDGFVADPRPDVRDAGCTRDCRR